MGNVTVSLLLPYPPWLCTTKGKPFYRYCGVCRGCRFKVNIRPIICNSKACKHGTRRVCSRRCVISAYCRRYSNGKGNFKLNWSNISADRRFSPLGTGWERCRSGRTFRQFYRKSSNLESQIRCRTEEISTKLNNKKWADSRFLQETRVTNPACNNPKSALAGLENW